MTKRRWWRFSLRALLVLMLLFGVACGMLGIKLAEMRRERAAIEQIFAWGQADYYGMYGPGIDDGPPPLTWEERTIRWLFGKPYHPRVYRVFCWVDTEYDPELANVEVDLRLLKDFELLKQLTVFFARVRHVQVLSRLTRLQDIHLEDADVEDASWLGHLPDLKSLDLSGNPIQRLPNALPCRLLSYVDLSRTRVEDLSCFRSCRKLDNLWLAKTHVADLTPIRNLELVYLDVSHTRVTSLQALIGNESLTSLSVAGCQIRSMPPVMSLTYLDISKTPIESLEFAREMKHLDTLIISETKIKDLGPIAHLRLDALGLGKTRVRDLSPLSVCALWKNYGSIQVPYPKRKSTRSKRLFLNLRSGRTRATICIGTGEEDWRQCRRLLAD